MIAFIVMMLFVSVLVIWQIDSTSPAYWCKLAEETSEGRTGCYTLLMKLVEVKDHTIIGLLSILGLAVAGLISVALGLNVRAGGPGGTSVDISERDTTVDTDGASVTIPTPKGPEE
jgi:hypothetical protein